MQPDLVEFAPAKVNLTLEVTGRRQDGYHLLDSLVVFAGVGDVLRAAPSPTLSLRLEGPFAAGLSETDNLALRAGRALADWAGLTRGAALTLEKNLPVASGIGGGSADAAACLRLLSRLWDLRPPEGALLEIAAGLGADVPVCLKGRPTRMRGIGDQLSDLDLPDCGLVLANPGLAVATGDVFRSRMPGFSPATSWPAAWYDLGGLIAWLEEARNDLQAPAIRICPAIDETLTALRGLPGCRLARMSGSGATCFGLFETPGAAESAAALLRRGWAWGGAMIQGRG